MTAFQFDCDFCETTVQTSDVDTLREQAQTHLETHTTELTPVFAEQLAGEACWNNCSYVFPDDANGNRFECSSCGHDHWPELLQQYVYWRISTQ